MIGAIYKLGDGTPWQIVAEGVLAKGPQDVWPELVVMQMLEVPYPVVVMEKEDSRFAGMTLVDDRELVMMSADRRVKLRKNCDLGREES